MRQSAEPKTSFVVYQNALRPCVNDLNLPLQNPNTRLGEVTAPLNDPILPLDDLNSHWGDLSLPLGDLNLLPGDRNLLLTALILYSDDLILPVDDLNLHLCDLIRPLNAPLLPLDDLNSLLDAPRSRLRIPFFDAKTQRRKESAENCLHSLLFSLCASLRLCALASKLVILIPSLSGRLRIPASTQRRNGAKKAQRNACISCCFSSAYPCGAASLRQTPQKIAATRQDFQTT